MKVSWINDTSTLLRVEYDGGGWHEFAPDPTSPNYLMIKGMVDAGLLTIEPYVKPTPAWVDPPKEPTNG